VNAAYLMLTTAWLAGADPAPAPAAPAAPVVSAPIGGGCGGGCGCATDACCEKEGFFAKLKAKFHKNDCGCGCEQAPTCCAPKPVCCPAPKPVCCPAPAPTCCHAAPVSCGCDECKPSLCERIKAKFKKSKDCGCDSGCGGCSTCGGGVIGGAPAEAIPAKPAPGAAPQAMPKPAGSVMMNGMIVTPVVAPHLSNDQPF
jgi:hypothetical protein